MTVSVRFGTPGSFRELKERIIDRCSTWAINKHNLWAKYFTSWRQYGWRLDCKLSYSVRRTTQLLMNFRWILMLRNGRTRARDVIPSIFYLFFFPPFIYFTSHLYCITRFEDEDAICRIKYQVTRIDGEGRI